MSEAARINSVEAIRDFQTSLSVFCDEARQALSAVDMEARRMVDWICHDQLHFWTRMVRQCQEEVTQAKAELFRKQMSGVGDDRPDVTEQRDNLRRAQARLEHAEDKVQRCKQWERQLQRPMEEYRNQAMHLGSLVEGDPPRIVSFLERVLNSVDSYLATAPVEMTARPRVASAPAEPPPRASAPAQPADAPPPAASKEPAAE